MSRFEIAVYMVGIISMLVLSFSCGYVFGLSRCLNRSKNTKYESLGEGILNRYRGKNK